MIAPNMPVMQWHFRVNLDGQPAVEMAVPQYCGALLWQLSECVLELQARGIVTVDRRINGAWENCNDWKKLAH